MPQIPHLPSFISRSAPNDTKVLPETETLYLAQKGEEGRK